MISLVVFRELNYDHFVGSTVRREAMIGSEYDWDLFTTYCMSRLLFNRLLAMTTEKATRDRRLSPFSVRFYFSAGDTCGDTAAVPQIPHLCSDPPGRDENTLFEFSFQMPSVQLLGDTKPLNI
jgi:hypothetical protein